MIRSFMVTASFALCWTLSPDVLVLLGNGIAQNGMVFLAVLLLGAAFSAMAANILHHPSLTSAKKNRTDFPSAGVSPFLAITLTLAGRLSPVLFLSTGMLVTAGFTFNETFIFWFPNFGFSFFLLVTILVLHLSGEKVALAAQLLFFCFTTCCLLFLSLAGLAAEPPVPQPVAVPAEIGPMSFFSLTSLSLLFFLGYDQQHRPDIGGKRWYYIVAIGIGFLLLALWGLVSLKHVPQTSLAESTVPYVTSAKAILGQPGRVIMGIAIVSGTCSAVNGLFYLSGRSLQQILPRISRQNQGQHPWFRRVLVIFMALVIALFLAWGLAGSENLEVYLFGALLFWLLTISANCLAAARDLQKQRKHFSHGYAIGALLLAAVAYLAFTYSQPLLLGSFLLLVLIASALFSAGWAWHNRKRNLAINNSKGDVV